MNIKHKFILVYIAIFIVIYVASAFVTTHYEPEKVEVANGVITDFQVESYSCGKYARDTCHDYFATISGSKISISESVYKTAAVGNAYHLVKEGDTPLWVKLVKYYFIIVNAVAVLFAALNICLAVVWSITQSDKVSCIEYIKNWWRD